MVFSEGSHFRKSFGGLFSHVSEDCRRLGFHDLRRWRFKTDASCRLPTALEKSPWKSPTATKRGVGKSSGAAAGATWQGISRGIFGKLSCMRI